MLYLGTQVHILLDISYVSRFWTQFEAWLSFQVVTRDGLISRVDDERRNHIVMVLNAGEHLAQALVKEWSNCKPEEAHQILSGPDVAVTNAKDKEEQLEKLFKVHAMTI